MTLLLLMGGALAAQEAATAKDDAATAAEEKASPETATHTVKPERFRVELKLDGVFESSHAAEVVLRPEVWKELQVVKAVEHGARVVEGDPLVWLDTEPLDNEIISAEQTVQLGELSLEQKHFALEQLEKSAPLDLTAAEHAKVHADEELAYFQETDRARSEESARFSLASSQHRLEYTQEELDQLQKMYEADDLTEETEEIILKRARRAVESAEFSLRSAELRTRRTLETELPRRERQLVEDVERQALNLARTQATLPVQLQEARIELAKLALKQKQTSRRLTQLKSDRELMVVRAPQDGIVYYGQLKRGKWQGMAEAQAKLQPGGKLAPGRVLMSVVAPRPLQVRIEVAEKDLRHLSEGGEGTVTPAAFPDVQLPSRIRLLSAVPVAAGKFDAVVEVETGNRAISLVPSMACEARFVAHDNPQALVVPASAVFSEDGQNFVTLVDADGEQAKRQVTVEQRQDDKIAIARGLNAGDKILVKGRP